MMQSGGSNVLMVKQYNRVENILEVEDVQTSFSLLACFRNGRPYRFSATIAKQRIVEIGGEIKTPKTLALGTWKEIQVTLHKIRTPSGVGI